MSSQTTSSALPATDDLGVRGLPPSAVTGPDSRRARRAAVEPMTAPLVNAPVLADRDLALTADRALAVRQLEGYTLGVGRRLGLTHQESVPPATGAYRDELLAEIARIDAELDRRSTSL